MANEIDLVVGSAVKTQLDTLMKELVKIDEQIQKIGDTAASMNTKLGVTNTADLTKLTAENEKLNKKIQELTGSSTVLETKLANLAAAQARATKAATDASIAEEKLLAATNKNTVATEKKTKATLADTIAQREATNATTLEIKAGQGLAKTYAELDAQHKIAVKNAQDLAVQTGRSGKAYEDAKLKANEYGKQLRVIDTDIGKHTRNVGNYSSSWNGLGNSINQLTREAPAFANSVQTGFMALSNNIPILTDELGVLIQKNKDLQAEGKPTQSILKTVAGAFFSWQTAISLGVTILTVYGAKLWDMVSGLDALKRKQEEYALSQKLMDNQIEQTTKNILDQAKLKKDASILAGESSDKQRKIDLQAEKDIQDNLVFRRDSDKKKYENAKHYADLEAKLPSIYAQGQEAIKQRIKINNELKKYKNYETTPEGLADLKNAATLSEGIVKEQGRKITLLKSAQKVEEYNEAKKSQEKIDKIKPERERKVLTFDEVKSEHDLAEAVLATDKIREKSADMSEWTTEQKIANLDLLSLTEIKTASEIANKEIDIANKKMADNKTANDLALKNNKEFATQHAKNILDIEKTNKNEILTANEVLNGKILESALNTDKAIKALSDEDLKSTQQLAIAKLNTEIIAEKLIIDNKVKGKNFTKLQQEEAFKEYIKLSLAKIDLEEKVQLASEPNPIKQEIIKQNFADLRKGIENILSPIEGVKKAFADLSTSGEVYNKSLSASLDKLGMSSLKTFLDFDEFGQSSFQKMWENADTTQKKTTVMFQAIGDVAQQYFGMISEVSEANFQEDLRRLEAQKEISLSFAGDSAVAKERIEEQFAKKKKELEIKQFKDKQKMAVANIAIDTAQAIMQIWAHSPDFTGISQSAMSIIIGALGAVQMGMVLTQKPPAYAEGTDNHSGGLMLVNDGKGSNFQEKVVLPSGKVIRPQGRNVLMDAPKGTKVLNHEQQLFEMLQSNNISMSSQQSSGLTYDEMNEIFQNNFANIKTQNTIFDKNGFQTYVRNGNSITRSNSNRSQAIGISV
jgi:hypothetical protein